LLSIAMLGIGATLAALALVGVWASAAHAEPQAVVRGEEGRRPPPEDTVREHPGPREAPEAPPDRWEPRDPAARSEIQCPEVREYTNYGAWYEDPDAIRAFCRPSAGHVWIRCTENNEDASQAQGWDLQPVGVVAVRSDAPEWWRNEIRWENVRPEGNGCDLAEHPPQPTCAQIREAERTNPRFDYRPDGIIPDDCWGRYPTAMYELSWEAGGIFDFAKWDNKMLGWTGSFMWTVGTYAITAVLWLVDYSLTFSMGDFTEAITGLARDYQLHLVGPFQLMDMAWLALVGWVGITALRGRVGVAVGEIVMTLLLLTLATVLFQNRGDYMESLALRTDQLSGGLLAASQGRDPTDVVDTSEMIGPLQHSVHEQFVEVPYADLNWGRNVSRADECLQAASRILSTGWDGGGWPNRYMWGVGNAIKGEHGGQNPCEGAANHNRDATKERMLGALLTMLVCFAVAATLGVLAFTALVCKFLLSLMFGLTPFVTVGSVLPGAGRRVTWWWVGTTFQAAATGVGSCGLLSMSLLGNRRMQEATAGMHVVERWTIVLGVGGIVYVGMKKWVGGTQVVSTRFADTLTRASPGAANWSSGGAVGFNLNAIPHAVEGSAKAVGRATTMGVMFNAAVAGRLATTPSRAGGRALMNWRRDRRNKRYGALNMRDNRHSMWERADRPHRHVRVEEKTDHLGVTTRNVTTRTSQFAPVSHTQAEAARRWRNVQPVIAQMPPNARRHIPRAPRQDEPVFVAGARATGSAIDHWGRTTGQAVEVGAAWAWGKAAEKWHNRRGPHGGSGATPPSHRPPSGPPKQPKPRRRSSGPGQSWQTRARELWRGGPDRGNIP
jgi:hypothetical protein